MKVLVMHNDYLQPSGESRSVAAEVQHLRTFGHEVELLVSQTKVAASHLELARHLVYATEVRAEIRQAIEVSRPDIVHVHNLFPWLGSSAIAAVAAANLPYVQTLRNYRTSCLSGNHYRNDAPCTLCTRSATAWQGVRFGCYRGSPMFSAGVMIHDATQRMHRRARAAARPARIIVLSNAMKKFIGPTLPDWAQVCVKYNSLAQDPAVGPGGGGIIFVARLAVEKGVRVLLDAWSHLPVRPPLTVVGEGPLAAEVRRAQTAFPELRYFPRLEHDVVMRLIGEADVLAAPALWEEPFGRTVMEALACGTPVLSTSVGAAPEVVGPAGWISSTAVTDFARLLPVAVRDAVALRGVARQRYETLLSPEATTSRLVDIYSEVVVPRASC